MANSNNKQSRGLISSAFGIAKKIGTTGFNVLNHVAPGTVSKMTNTPKETDVIQGTAQETQNPKKVYDNPQAMMRDHIPLVSRQLLGKHYSKINNVTSFISPELNNKLADYFFDKLNGFVSELSSVDGILKEVGAKDLKELAQNPARSGRISQAFENQNKRYAVIQGAVTGLSGVIGAAIDVPTSIGLALHSIYQTGRAYGFELKTGDGQEIVEFIFKQIDLGTVAEKQALLVAVRAVANLLQTHDVNQLQQLLGSSNDVEYLKKWIGNDDGSFKWEWLNNVPQLSIVAKLTPLAGAGIGAYYSLKLLNDATTKAQTVFANARDYINQHPDEDLDIIQAFEKFHQKQQSISLLDAPISENNEAKSDLESSKKETLESNISDQNQRETNVVPQDTKDELSTTSENVEINQDKAVEKVSKPRATRATQKKTAATKTTTTAVKKEKDDALNENSNNSAENE